MSGSALTIDDAAFDEAVITAVFTQAGVRGWRDVSLVEAAQDAGLDLKRVRARFPGRSAVLLRFGVLLDQAALTSVSIEDASRERLFDLLMNRFEALQRYREGVLALMRALPTDPAAGLLIYGATLRSMKWLLEAAGIPTTGLTGLLRVHGLMAVWAYALRAWEGDDLPDLSRTMRAIDQGLDRAMQAERSLPCRAPGSAPDPAVPTPTIGDVPGSEPAIV